MPVADDTTHSIDTQSVWAAEEGPYPYGARRCAYRIVGDVRLSFG